MDRETRDTLLEEVMDDYIEHNSLDESSAYYLMEQAYNLGYGEAVDNAKAAVWDCMTELEG